MSEAQAGFDSYRHKLFGARPEMSMLERFLPPQRRIAIVAFECLVQELNDAALRIVEPHVAEAKLAWWYAELGAALAGTTRHPITRALLPQPLEHVDPQWIAAIQRAAAMLRRESGVGNTAEQMQIVSAWFAALLEFGQQAGALMKVDMAAAARTRAANQLMRELARLRPGGIVHTLTLPLNLLARHQLTRADLDRAGAARDAAVRDQLRQLQEIMVPAPVGADLYTRVQFREDRSRLREASAAADPCACLLQRFGQLRAMTVWHIWREARRGRG